MDRDGQASFRLTELVCNGHFNRKPEERAPLPDRQSGKQLPIRGHTNRELVRGRGIRDCWGNHIHGVIRRQSGILRRSRCRHEGRGRRELRGGRRGAGTADRGEGSLSGEAIDGDIGAHRGKET